MVDADCVLVTDVVAAAEHLGGVTAGLRAAALHLAPDNAPLTVNIARDTDHQTQMCSGETVLLFLEAEEEEAMDMVSVAGDLPVETEEESEDELSSGTS